jgi:hypothetical protein
MATIPMPPLTYQTSLPESVLEGGLSAVQLEAITIAGQQNDIVLPGGFRASALIGDGTGVGKGRISAGVLYDNYLKGRKRLIWVSEKWDLMQDAMRDLAGIGAEDLMRGLKMEGGKFVAGKNPGVIGLNKFKAPDYIKHDGVLFTTYSLIRSVDKKGNRRIAQIERYLRGEDDGDGAYILFDESHNLKNAVTGPGGKASQIGVAIKELMQRMPKLRSVSLSATAATDVVNLGYLDRLGLWGPGTAFPGGFQEFQAQVGSGGLAAMEMIARELKAQGKYVSRTLSFKGTSYDEAEHKLTPEQKELYRTAAKAWASIIESAEKTIEETTNGGSLAKARFMSLLGSAQQRFFNVLITTFKIPTCIELANQALEENKSVVITLVNTNEAAQNREKNKARNRDDEDEEEEQEYDFGPKEMITSLVKEHYPIQQFRDDVDANGRPVKVPVFETDPKTGREIPVVNPEAVAARDELLKEIEQNLYLPENPLDILINGLGGPSEVAELTGRKEYFDRATNKFVPRGDPNAARKDVNILEQRAFMSGKKRVAVLSNAAGTGISLHASNTAANRQKRFHITLQPGWSADKAMQMLGRTHRTNQAHAPEYMMLVSDLGGEKRFVSTISKRLGSLGALTKGQKNATGGSDLMSKVNFETEQGQQATNAFYSALLRGEVVPGTDLSGLDLLQQMRVLRTDPQSGSVTVSQEDRFNVTRLLNRLLALDPDIQNAAYNYFYDIFEAAVKDAIDRGTLDTGVRELAGDEFDVKEAREIARDPQTGAKTFYYRVESRIRNERVSPEELDKRLRRYRNERDDAHLRIGENGEILLARKAPPIVHADGTSEGATYLAAPGNGKWIKVADKSLYKTPKVEEWAAKQHEILSGKVAELQRRIESQRSYIQRYGDSTGWEKRELDRLQGELDAIDPQAQEAAPIAANPEEWAKQKWAEQYAAAPTHSIVEHHLIGGAVMKYWNPIKDATHIRNSIFSTTDSKTGQRVVGIKIDPRRIESLIARIEGGKSTVTPEQIYADVLKNGTPYTLERNIRIKQGLIGRIPVVQLIPSGPEVARRLVELGAIYERGMAPIYYLPTEASRGDSRGMVTLMRIMKEFPVRQESKEEIHGEASRKPITPQLSGNRSEAYTLNAPDSHHILRARMEPIRLSAEDAKNALAFVVNMSGLEMIGRVSAGYRVDEAGLEVNGIHFAPENFPGLLGNLAIDAKQFQQVPPALLNFRKALLQAQREKISLIFVKDHRLITEDQRTATLEEELNHALQYVLTGPAETHLGASAQAFIRTPIGARAETSLKVNFGYNFQTPGKAAYEIGERLMRKGGYKDLNISLQEVRTLAADYVRFLRKEHGDQAADQIGSRIAEALGESASGEESRSPTLSRGTQDFARSRPEDRGSEAGENARQPVQGFYLGSGLGSLQPAYEVASEATRQFLREEVVPKVAAILRGSRETIDNLVNLVDPRRRVPTKTLDTIYRMKGGRDAANYLLSRQLDKWGKRVDQMSRDEMVNFIDRMKTGHKQPDPELQQLANFIRKVDDALYEEIAKYRPSLDYLENHFRVLWKVIPGSPEAKGGFRGVFRRPLQGSKGCLTQAKLEAMSEGLELGGIPYTYNPVKMFQAHYADAMKYITAQRMWEEFEKMGVRQFVRHGQSAPPGYVRLNDRIANVYFPVKEGTVHAGDWYVEEGAARVLNNFLSRDLIREQPFGRALMSIKNGTTALELSLSPFHAVFEGLEAVSSEIGIGLRQLWNVGVRQREPGALLAGARTLATAPKAAVSAARLGSQAKEAFANYGEFIKTPVGKALLKRYPDLRSDLEAFFNGGGRMGMHEDYKVQAFNTFREYLKSAGRDNPGPYLSAAIRSIPAFNQAIMRPLFEWYIPNLKLGFFLKEFNLAKAEYSDRLASGEMTLDSLARQVVDSVENRFGEMNFDNLFWDRTFKTATQLLFRSVTWKLGNLRANVSAATGQYGEFARAMSAGEAPMLHPNMAWLLGMILFTTILGGTMYWLGTGERPKQVKDFVYPIVGGIRVSLATYARDLVHLFHSPLGYLKSSLSGELGRIADLWQNKDFYGNEVWNPDDPLPVRAWDMLRHLVPLPFSISSGIQAKQQGGSKLARVAGYLGFTKAPRYIEQTDAENLASEYLAAHRETGARTARAAARAQAMAGIRNMYRRGADPAEQIQDALQKGLIAPRDVPKLRLQARRPRLEAMIQSLPVTEALKVYDVATPEEKKGIQALIRKKILAARLKPWEWTPQARSIAEKQFHLRLPVRSVQQDFASPSVLY